MDPLLAYVDFVTLVVLAGLSFYGFRTATLLIKMPETERMRDLWLPILMLPILLFVVSFSSFVNDAYGVNSIAFEGTRDLVVLVAATLLTYSLGSFYGTWREYKKERNAGLAAAGDKTS